MQFVLTIFAPRLERVVHHHSVLEHLVIVVQIARESERDRCESRCFRREFQASRISATDDDRELLKRRVVEVVVLEKASKLQKSPAARNAHQECHKVLHRVLLRHPERPSWNVEKLGVPLYKTRDQPRTGDSIDLWPF